MPEQPPREPLARPRELPDWPREPPLPYNGLALDRAAGRRADDTWLRGVARRPGSRLLALWQDKCLVDASGRAPVTVPMADAGCCSARRRDSAGTGDGAAPGDVSAPDRQAAGGRQRPPVFLGLDGEAGVFAVDLSDAGETAAARLAGARAAVDTRHLFPALDAQRAAALAYARGLLRWHRDQRFCGACGAAAVPGEGGHLRACTGPGCGRLHFPRIEPAVIVVVEAPGTPPRCLLGRHRGAEAGAFALIAGFVDIGESFEDAVRREVAEETGVPVGGVCYAGSQAWPYPSGIMVGFLARAASDAISVDGDELVEARWFTRAGLAAHRAARPRTHGDSIGTHLLDAWLAAGD
jgi:NAD+ diphosphatase